MQKLVDWLQIGGSEISPKITTQSLPGRGRAIVATDHIEPNEVLICIRPSQLLNVTNVPDRDERLSSHQQLALFIYNHQKNPKLDNVWAAFLDQMPTMEDFSEVPLTWPAEKISRCPTWTQDHVKKQQATFDEDFKQAQIVSKTSLDQQLFLWAWLCVNTRCLYMKLPGVYKHSDNMTMAPYVDFLNHSDNDTRTVKVQVTPKGMFVTATVGYDAGDEIFLHYGAHDNSFLLCEYGFVAATNKWDTINVTEYILAELPMESQQELQQAGYFGDYTVTKQGPSFRTEVALACWYYGGFTSKVEDLTSGEYDQQVLQHLYKPLIMKVLTVVADELDMHQPLTPGYLDIITTLQTFYQSS